MLFQRVEFVRCGSPSGLTARTHARSGVGVCSIWPPEYVRRPNVPLGIDSTSSRKKMIIVIIGTLRCPCRLMKSGQEGAEPDWTAIPQSTARRCQLSCHFSLCYFRTTVLFSLLRTFCIGERKARGGVGRLRSCGGGRGRYRCRGSGGGR